MAMNNSNWYIPSEGYNQPGSHTMGGGGYGHSYEKDGSVVQYRSPLDAARSARGQLPQAQYPDGYLGSLSQDRRQDKLLDAVTQRLTKRSYQRGVHKGERISHTDYFWPPDSDPMRRIKAEARYTMDTPYTMDVRRFAPSGNPVERLAHLGKLGGLSTPEQMGLARQYGVDPAKNPVVVSDPSRRARMQKMLPQYARTM